MVRTFYYFATLGERRNSWKIDDIWGEFSKFVSLHELDLKSGSSNELVIFEVHRIQVKVCIRTNHPEYVITVSYLKRHFEINTVLIVINFIKI